MARSKPAGDQSHNSSECGHCVTTRREELKLLAFVSILPHSGPRSDFSVVRRPIGVLDDLRRSDS
jgi:hypothetical protein